jgi:hypothetical protein
VTQATSMMAAASSTRTSCCSRSGPMPPGWGSVRGAAAVVAGAGTGARLRPRSGCCCARCPRRVLVALVIPRDIPFAKWRPSSVEIVDGDLSDGPRASMAHISCASGHGTR